MFGRNKKNEEINILKYVEGEKNKIETVKQNKVKRKEKIKKEIEKLEKKVNEEVEKEDVVLKCEAKIKILKNQLRAIELEPLGELNKEYIYSEIQKKENEIIERSGQKENEVLGKIYDLISELIEEDKKRMSEVTMLRKVARISKIEYGDRNIYGSSFSCSNNMGNLTIRKSDTYGIKGELTIAKEDFKK